MIRIPRTQPIHPRFHPIINILGRQLLISNLKPRQHRLAVLNSLHNPFHIRHSSITSRRRNERNIPHIHHNPIFFTQTHQLPQNLLNIRTSRPIDRKRNTIIPVLYTLKTATSRLLITKHNRQVPHSRVRNKKLPIHNQHTINIIYSHAVILNSDFPEHRPLNMPDPVRVNYLGHQRINTFIERRNIKRSKPPFAAIRNPVLFQHPPPISTQKLDDRLPATNIPAF